jgi:hypothetical protein
VRLKGISFSIPRGLCVDLKCISRDEVQWRFWEECVVDAMTTWRIMYMYK